MSYFEFPHTRTYDSDLGWLIKEVKRIASEYDSLVAYMQTQDVRYEDIVTRVTALENNISSFEAEINTRFSDLQSDINSEFNILSRDLTNSLNSQIQHALSELNKELGNIRAWLVRVETALNRQRIDLNGEIQSYYKLSKDYTDYKLEALINSIPDLTTVNVLNPVKGYITSIQVAINDLYDIGRPDALTAAEYDALGLTAAEYDALGLTALEYDLYGKKLLEQLGIWKNPAHYMYNPFSGEYVPISQVVLELSYLHQSDALTAAEYDDREVTAENYDALDLTAYQYDWHGKTLVI